MENKFSELFKSIEKQIDINEIEIDIEEKTEEKDIAIIGMSGRFPMAKDLSDFWSNIQNGVDCITKIPKHRKEDIDHYIKKSNRFKGTIKHKEIGYLDNIDEFDYQFFNITPKEANLMDPIQRIFLQESWSAIEEAGYCSNKINKTETGIYLGFSQDLFCYAHIVNDIDPSSMAIALPGNIPGIHASRISYLLDLKGPAINIDTSCSSSLVAVHLACQALNNNDCKMALAGGIKIRMVSLKKNLNLGIESSTYRTKSYDNKADGTGSGEGVGVVLLKPLKNALEDGDNIHAIIKGSAINHDGSSIGITAPNPSAQEAVIAKAWEDAGIEPETISFIEGHGTGTKLGDPVEIEALNRAFKRFTNKERFCAVSSIKSNIGHLDSAAGIAGLIKAILSLKNQKIAPTVHYHSPNKKINFTKSPVFITNKLIDWKSNFNIRRCGVSSFGISGTNCHVILEEFPKVNLNNDNLYSPKILTISAKNKNSLNMYIQKYLLYLNNNNVINLDDLCFTANTGREHFRERIAIVFRTLEELLNLLKETANCLMEGCTCPQRIFVGEIDKEIESQTITPKSLEDYTPDIQHQDKSEQVLLKIAKLYTQGAKVVWEDLYIKEPRRRISVPTYPFEKLRCWIEDSRPIEKNYFYKKNWVEDYNIPQIDKSIITQEKILIINNDNKLSNSFIKLLNKYQLHFIIANIGDTFNEINEDKFTIRGIEQDYRALFRKIDGITKIVLIHSHSSTKDYYHGPEKLINLVKNLTTRKYKALREIIILSDYVNCVTNHEGKLIPENSMMFGLGKVAQQETSDYIYRAIDVDDFIDENVIKEILSNNNHFQVAFRNGIRYKEVISEQDINIIEKKSLIIKEEGVYIIVGGLGKLGLKIAEHFSVNNKNINLVLINRSEFPERKKWERILENFHDNILCNKINRLLELERTNSSKIEILSLDICNEEETKSSFDFLRKKYGKINGIVHSAGTNIGERGNNISDLNKDIFLNKILSKVKGTVVIDRVTADDELDFFVLFSSAVTLIGGRKSGSYISANSFQESYSLHRNKLGKKTLSISWPTWKDENLDKVSLKRLEENQLFKLIEPIDAIKIFDQLINTNVTHSITGELNYCSPIMKIRDTFPFLFDQNIQHEIFSKNNENRGIIGKEKRNMKLSLTGKEKNIEYTQLEIQLGQMWSDLLGFDQFNIHDDFFEIGGTSIHAVNLEIQLEEEYGVSLEDMIIYSYSTIYELSLYIEYLLEESQ